MDPEDGGADCVTAPFGLQADNPAIRQSDSSNWMAAERQCIL